MIPDIYSLARMIHGAEAATCSRNCLIPPHSILPSIIPASVNSILNPQSITLGSMPKEYENSSWPPI